MNLILITLKSILSRKLITTLLILSIGLSALLLIGVQKIKVSAKESFSRSIYGTDLIIGARTSDIQLLLYSVFRQGTPLANLSIDSLTIIENYSEVQWVIPISLGDSHNGFPVMGTTENYFNHYRYQNNRPISLKSGTTFTNDFDIVIGSEVADKLNYKIGNTLYLSHGLGIIFNNS